MLFTITQYLEILPNFVEYCQNFYITRNKQKTLLILPKMTQIFLLNITLIMMVGRNEPFDSFCLLSFIQKVQHLSQQLLRPLK